MTLATALRQGVDLLTDGRVPVPRLTAEVLLAHALNKDRSYLFAHSQDELTEVAWIHYGRYLHERLQGKPTQYITHVQEFYGRPFEVTPAVLIPRPETEHVVETVLRLAPDALEIADIGCGSGAIAVTLAAELAGANVLGTDISTDAITVAARNALRNGTRVSFVQCDLCAAIGDNSLDVLASNPPYVPDGDRDHLQAEVRDYEPAIALFGGPTGSETYARLIPEAARVLRPGGWLVLELGFQSLAPVTAMLGAQWRNVESVADLAGYPRVLAAQRQAWVDSRG
ncbi:MAG: peptide chain release factor N(5)-glutamine methyltransferase [Candidatus Solibacter usitatus]|nr:peptide chain release factor N(5)-glutamine methyltransferase [Candidatus Solibacter usitatus]